MGKLYTRPNIMVHIIGYCTCMGIYCVERVLLAELPELARATMPKERVQHNIFPYKCNNLFYYIL